MGKLGYNRLHNELNWATSVHQLLAAYQTALKKTADFADKRG